MTRLVVLLLALAFAPRLASAGDDPHLIEARGFFEAGKQAYESGQYAVAATAFEEAYRLAPRPTVAFSMAQAYRRQFFVDRDPAKLKRALDLYKQYIVDVPQGGRRDDAVQYIAELEPMLVRIENEQQQKGMGPVKAVEPSAREATQLMISSRTKGASARIDGAAAAEVPVIRDVAPGTHKVHVEAPGYFAEDVEGIAVDGRLIVVEVTLREQPARVALHTGEGAEIAIDGRVVTQVSRTRPLEVPSGRHVVTVTLRGHEPWSRVVRLERGQTLELEAPLPATRQRLVAYGFLGAAGSILLAGGVTTTLALVHQGRAQDILDRRSRGPISQADLDRYDHEHQARDTDTTASALLLGGAAVVAATGALLFFADNPRPQASDDLRPEEAPPPADSGLSLSPSLGEKGMMGLVLSGAF